MYKCIECGHIFEEGEQVKWMESRGEHFGFAAYEHASGCPMCNGDYAEAEPCKSCGMIPEDDLYEGWCADCLREEIDFETFFDYCEAHREERLLDIFVMGYILNGMECPNHVSLEFHDLMVETYQRAVERTKAFPDMYDLKKDCIDYIMEADGLCGREAFAYWLNKRNKEVKK